MKSIRIKYFALFLLAFNFLSCSSGKTDDSAQEAEIVPQTPVTVTSVNEESMKEYIELSATSGFLQKSVINANMNGYINAEHALKGKFVNAGEVLFSIITKEARAIGSSINKLDPSFKFTGISTIKASQSGYIIDLKHQKGDYVQEGEQLAVISNRNSFVFLMDVPYEYHEIVRTNKQAELTLPDGKTFSGYITSSLPTVDSISQTQRFAVKINSNVSIPEGLIAKVKVLKSAKNNSISIAKSAVLTDETEEEFWVMKLINDSTAVKIPIKKGLEVGDKIEILSPTFSPQDKIITVGNYGLADTAKVKVIHTLQ